jgi:hypothetical protein
MIIRIAMIASLMETFMLLCVAAREGFAGLEMGMQMQIERIGVLARQEGSENLQVCFLFFASALIVVSFFFSSSFSFLFS